MALLYQERDVEGSNAKCKMFLLPHEKIKAPTEQKSNTKKSKSVLGIVTQGFGGANSRIVVVEALSAT
jgi:hypothetical protein